MWTLRSWRERRKARAAEETRRRAKIEADGLIAWAKSYQPVRPDAVEDAAQIQRIIEGEALIERLERLDQEIEAGLCRAIVEEAPAATKKALHEAILKIQGASATLVGEE